MKLLDFLKVVENSLVELRYNPSFKTDFESIFICELEFNYFNELEDLYPEYFALGYMDYLFSCDVISVFNGSNSLLIFLEDSF